MGCERMGSRRVCCISRDRFRVARISWIKPLFVNMTVQEKCTATRSAFDESQILASAREAAPVALISISR